MEDKDLQEAFPFLFKKQEERSKAKMLDQSRILNKEVEKYQSFKEAVATTLSNKRSSLSQTSNFQNFGVAIASGRGSTGPAGNAGTGEISIKHNRQISQVMKAVDFNNTFDPSPTINNEYQEHIQIRVPTQVNYLNSQNIDDEVLIEEPGQDQQPIQMEEYLLDTHEFDFLKDINLKKQEDRKGLFRVHGKDVLLSPMSLFCLSNTNDFRWGLVWLIKWKWFDRFIMICIFINAIVLSQFDYNDRESLTAYNKGLNYVTDGFTVIFLVECWLKIIAMGFVFNRYSYLRNTWNLIDFLIVVSGAVDFLRFKIQLKSLRILRVIRPLRSVKAIPSMRRLVSTLLKSLPELGQAGIFIAFMLFLFTILGLQQFSGIVYYKCRTTDKPINNGTYWPKSLSYPRVCSSNYGGGYECPSGTYCGSPLEYNISLINDGVYDDKQIQYSIGSFANFGDAFLGVIQILTAEGWSKLMDNISDGFTPIFVNIYFIFIIIIGHFYMMQLLLAVIMQNLAKIQTIESVEKIYAKRILVKEDRRKKKEKIKMLRDKQQIQIDQNFIKGGEEEIKIADEGNTGGILMQSKEIKQSSIVDLNSSEKQSTRPPTLNKGFMSKKKEKNDNLLDKQILAGKKDVKYGKTLTLKLIPENVINNSQTLNLQGSQRSKNNILTMQEEEDHEPIRIQEVQNVQSKMSFEQDLGFIGSFYENKPEITEDQKIRQNMLDEVIKQNFMWHLGKASKQTATDMSKGTGLAILARVVGVEEIEYELRHFVEKIQKLNKIESLQERLEKQLELLDDIGIMSRKLELEVTKKYQTSRKTVYGVDNELHLVEQIQKALTLIYKNSEETDVRNSIVMALEHLLRDRRAEKQREINEDLKELELEPHEKEFQLTEQMHLVLKLAMNLKDISQQQEVKDFFFARFKRQLYKKNIIDLIQQKAQDYLEDTQLMIRTNGRWFQSTLYKIQNSSTFNILSIIVIFANAVTLALSSYPVNIDREKRVEIINLIFFGFFFFELLIKIIGLGIRHYFQDRYNWFDFAVVGFSTIDIILEYTVKYTESGSGAITALRVFRLIKIFKLAQIWKDFQQLLIALSNTLVDVSNLGILILVFIFTYMLLGLELFAFKESFSQDDKYDSSSNGIYPKINFNTPFSSFISVFIVLANEGWSQLYQNAYRSTDPWSTSIFFYSLVVIGQFVLMNLFLAVLVENFEELSVRNDLMNKLRIANQRTFWEKIKDRINYCLNRQSNLQFLPKVSDDLATKEYEEMKKQQDAGRQKQHSLYIFNYNSSLRQFLIKLVSHRHFETFMLISIIISTIQLATDNPLRDQNSKSYIALTALDKATTIFFFLEAIAKIISFGLISCGSTSYLKSNWNILDLIIVIGSFLSFGLPDSNLNLIKVIRLMKLLRPLRAISRNQGLMITVKALGVAYSGIINVIIVIILFVFILSVIGINYFKGVYYECIFGPFEQQFQRQNKNKWDCINTGGQWNKLFLNFDNIFNAMQSLFITCTAVNWIDIMQVAAFSNGVDMIPSETITKPLAVIFFVIVVIIGNFFLLNLFVGVIITTYNREKELVGKDFMLTDLQKKWLKNRKMIVAAEPRFFMKLPLEDWRQPFFYTAEYWAFQYFIMACILANTVVLTIQYQGMSKKMALTLDNLNYIFTGIFTAEFFIKIVAYGEKYFRENWNIFDMVIIILTLLGIVLGWISDLDLGPQTTIIRSFRIARVFYLFKRNKALRSTFITFLLSLTGLVNIGSLILLIIFMYSVLGVYLFSTVKLNGELSEKANFQSITNSFLMMIRIMTGENWPKFMEALSRQHSPGFDCIKSPKYQDYVNDGYKTIGCGDQVASTIFFYSYVVLITMIFMKLFIAIILQTFQEISEKDNKFVNNNLSDFFRDQWAYFDPEATGFIKVNHYPKFLLSLGDPLGWDISYEHDYIKQREYKTITKLPRYNMKKEYSFMDVFEQLILIMIIRREVVNFAIRHDIPMLMDTKNEDMDTHIQNINKETIKRVQESFKGNAKQIQKNYQDLVDDELELMYKKSISIQSKENAALNQSINERESPLIKIDDNRYTPDREQHSLQIQESPAMIIKQSLMTDLNKQYSLKYQVITGDSSRRGSIQDLPRRDNELRESIAQSMQRLPSQELPSEREIDAMMNQLGNGSLELTIEPARKSQQKTEAPPKILVQVTSPREKETSSPPRIQLTQVQGPQFKDPNHLHDEMMMVEEELSKIESSMVVDDDHLNNLESKKDR